MDNNDQNRGKKIPHGWLVTGGLTFKDCAFVSKAEAVKSAQERGDGARVEPLYLDNQLPPAPVAEDLSGQPAGKVRDDAMMHNQAMVEFYPGKRPRIGEPVYTHPQPAIGVDSLAQYIRKIDGNNDMGAGALAESICNWIEEQQSE